MVVLLAFEWSVNEAPTENWTLTSNIQMEDEIAVDITVGIPEIEKEPVFICFPNPSTGYLSLQLKDERKEAAIIHVLDLLGNLIYTSTVAAGEKNVQLDLHEFSVGLYAIQIISGDKISRRMITLAR